MLTDTQKVNRYVRKVSQHLYAHKRFAYKIHGYTPEYDSVGKLYIVVVHFDTIHYAKDEDSINIKGIIIGRTVDIGIDSWTTDVLQYVKNEVRRRFTRKSTSMRKKYWTKLVRRLRWAIK